MISWLSGKKVEVWEEAQKKGLILNCAGVGYEIQVLPKEISNINSSDQLIFWVHQFFREDGYSLYGFKIKAERDLFRKLISINGVGPQIAIGLLEKSNLADLVEAIIQQNIQKLSEAHGVGKRTAERIAIELRNKLSDFLIIDSESSPQTNLSLTKIPLAASEIKEIKSALTSIGYEEFEIQQALTALAKENPNHDLSDDSKVTPIQEAWLNASLRWLSKEAS